MPKENPGARGRRADADVALRLLQADDRDHAGRHRARARFPLRGAALFQRRRRRPQGPLRPVDAARHAPHQGRLRDGARQARRTWRCSAPTTRPPDGTCIRDYIHVTDLVRAHMAALAPSARRRRVRHLQLRLLEGLLGAAGDRGGEARLGRRLRGAPVAAPRRAIRRRSSPPPTRSACASAGARSTTTSRPSRCRRWPGKRICSSSSTRVSRAISAGAANLPGNCDDEGARCDAARARERLASRRSSDGLAASATRLARHAPRCACCAGAARGRRRAGARRRSVPRLRWRALWPEAQALGVSRATFDAAFRGLTPDLLAARSRSSPGASATTAPARPSSPSRRMEYLNPKYLGIARRAGPQVPQGAREGRSSTSRRRPASTATSWSPSGAARPPTARTSCRTTPSACWRRRPTPGGARTSSARSCSHALKMLQDGVPRAKMRSSWAGAVGLTQFMPTEYFKHADDGDGDGKADIFDSVPDALGLRRAPARQQGLGARPALGLRGAHAASTAIARSRARPARAPIGDWLKLGFERAGAQAVHAPTSSASAPI